MQLSLQGPIGLTGADAVIDTSYIDSLVQSYISNSVTNNEVGGGCDFKFPEGINGDAITFSFNWNSPYTVPTGKRLYINNLSGQNNDVQINGIIIDPFEFPIIANEGDILSNNVSQDTRINGLLTNNSTGLDAITFHLIEILHILFRQVRDFILIIFQDKTMMFKLMVLS